MGISTQTNIENSLKITDTLFSQHLLKWYQTTTQVLRLKTTNQALPMEEILRANTHLQLMKITWDMFLEQDQPIL